MFWILRLVKELLIRLRLYLFGVRFYECGYVFDHPLVQEAEYRIDSEHRVRVQFFRVECSDIIMKGGELIGDCYVSYIVKGRFDSNFPQDVRMFDEKAFYFNGRVNRFNEPEQQTVELLLDIYLDFVKTSLKGNSRDPCQQGS